MPRLLSFTVVLRIVIAVAFSMPTCGQAIAQSETRQLLAEPKPQGASPYMPRVERDVKLPVMLQGFCVVTLRERQQWVQGSEANQLIFDGQLYWFASQRERAIFAGAPKRYVPALGGDCVVTFAETGSRVKGNAEYGILHDKRLYFFRDATQQEIFRSEPKQYADRDLANDGECLVSRIDKSRRLPGLPETTTIVNGLRYQFASTHQQRQFLSDMYRYGVEPPKSTANSRLAGKSLKPRSADSHTHAGSAQNEKKPQAKSAAEIENKAMAGYCPVSIRDSATWVLGDAQYVVEFDGQNYLMAGEQQRTTFLANPTVYVPALGGHCVVTEVDENRRVPGSIYHAAFNESDGRLYLFAGAKYRQAFHDDPAKYVEADLVNRGNCVVSWVDEGRDDVPGLPELLIWHNSKRYLFASKEHQEIFRKNIKRYQDR